MPTPDARAAFAAAQRIADQMRHVHSQEQAVERMKDQTSASATVDALDRELSSLRNDWTLLAGEYTEAIRRFTKAAEEARQARGQ